MTQTGERHNLSKPLVLECAKIKKGKALALCSLHVLFHCQIR